MTLEIIQLKYREIALTLQAIPKYRESALTLQAIPKYRETALECMSSNGILRTMRDDNVGLHSEYRAGKYTQIFTERGSVNFRRETEDSDEFLSWLVKALTRWIRAAMVFT